MSIKNDEGLSGFGQKLMCLMLEKECYTPKALAIKLLESKLVTVKTRGEDVFTYKSANAAYAGILFNISRNVAGFIEYELQPAVRQFSEQFEKKYEG